MIYEEILEKRKLKHKQEDLLEAITELKKINRAKIITLNKQIHLLNNMADGVCDVKKDKLKMYILKLNQLRQGM